MAATANSIVAFFSNESNAAEAIDALHAAGFQAHEIGAATNTGYTAPAGYTGGSAAEPSQTAGSGTAAKAGQVWDRVKNFFEGDAAQPGSTVSGTSGDVMRTGEYDAYEPGDVSHSLGGMNIPESRSRYFENKFATGSGVLVTVSPTTGRDGEAEAILKQYGGDLGTNAETYNYSAPTAAAATTTAAATAPATGQQRIQLLGEVLRVHKDRISRGEVRIRKEVITEQQTVQVPVSREELVIERLPVTGQTTAAGAIGDTGEIRIPLTEEHASATTETFVREEVNIGKRSVENVEQVGGAIRREELEVEDETTGTTVGVNRTL